MEGLPLLSLVLNCSHCYASNCKTEKSKKKKNVNTTSEQKLNQRVLTEGYFVHNLLLCALSTALIVGFKLKKNTQLCRSDKIIIWLKLQSAWLSFDTFCAPWTALFAQFAWQIFWEGKRFLQNWKCVLKTLAVPFIKFGIPHKCIR